MMEDPSQIRISSVVAEKKKTGQREIARHEVKDFLNNLEARVSELTTCRHKLQKKGLNVHIHDFLEFQNLTSENLAFMIIIEGRLKKLARFDEGDLHEQFEELVVAVWGIIMRGALDFLNAISSETHLPLGAREVFLRELRTLNDAHLKLSEERYKKRLSDDTEKVMQTAERILEEVIEKVPALLRF